MQQVISQLEQLGRRGRLMLVAQRSSVLLALALGATLALILFDFALRLPSAFRLVLLLAGAAALGYGIWVYLRTALVFRPSLTQLALRVERVLPSVAGRLASSVEFAAAGVDRDNALAARSVRETQARLAGESVSRVISVGQTWRHVGVMLGVAATCTALTIADPTTTATGLTRLLLPYGTAQWPARTGVQSMTTAKVHPRGAALALRAAVTRGALDQRVDAHYRLCIDDVYQPWQRIVLTHQGGGSIHERLIDTNAQEVELYFSTDDDQTTAQRIELVPPPAVRRASLTVQPPAYAQGRVPVLQAELGQGLDDRAVTDTASLIGSEVTLRFELNKPLPVPSGDAAPPEWLRSTFGWNQAAGDLPRFTVDSSDPANAAVWTLQWRLAGTQSLSLNLIDEHGLANAEPIAYRIEAVEDHAPAVTITKPQADEVVLPSAVVELSAEARDDVALSTLGLESHVQAGGRNAEETMAQSPAWAHRQQVDGPEAAVQAQLDLGPLHLAEGDIVLLSGVAQDVYSEPATVPGTQHSALSTQHTVHSPLRRLRVISETDFATQLRRQLGAVRQNAIRIEAQQGELQDDVIEGGVPPGSGMDRAQAQIGERIASQRASVEDIERMLQQNRLDDPPLAQLLQQTQDLLDYAGRSANKAVEAIEKRRNVGPPTSNRPNEGVGDQQKADGAAPLAPGSAGGQSQPSKNQGGAQPNSPTGEPNAPSGRPQDGNASPKSPDSNPKSKIQNPKSPTPPEDLREPAAEDRPIVEAQQEVRDELTDLIKLLDRDEDTWVVQRQLENLLKEQSDLEAATAKLGEQTIGRKPEELPEQQRTEMDRAAQRQRDVRDEARKLTENLHNRAKAMEQVDPQSAQGMRNAGQTAERQQLAQDMENAAQKIQQNQMTSAAASQQSAQSTLQRMLNDIQDTRRANAQQLIRQLTSLVESIQRLITVQENELTALALAIDTQNFSGLDRSMIRLNQNTLAVAGEARAAGQEARRVARSLDRAADTQGAAATALRAQPIDAAEAQDAENRSLDLLKEAKALAEELQKKTQDQELQKRREELMNAYSKFAERQVAVRGETLPLVGLPQLDRRQLVEARRLGSAQDEIRTGLNQLRDLTSEILDSPVFSHVHRSIDTWSASITESLVAGSVTVDVTDRQQQIADSIGRLIKALEESITPPDEFAKEQNNQNGSGGQGGQQQPLIPPVAQLKLLQGLQEQVYNLTRDLDSRSDLDAAQRRARMRDVGQQQRELMDLGKKMIEALQRHGQPEIRPGQPAEPTNQPQPEPVPPEPGPGEPQA